MVRTRRIWAVNAVFVGAMASVVFFVDGANAYVNTYTCPNTRQIVATMLRHANVVLLGDSYLAGPGGSNPNPIGGCYSSTDNVGALLQASVGKVTDFSCSGAITGYGADPGGVSKLSDQLSTAVLVDPNPDIVVVSIGGNDLHFADALRGCLGAPDCDPVTAADPSSNGDLNALAVHFTSLINTTYSNVSAAYPDAQVIVEAYPNLLPDSSTPAGFCLFGASQPAIDKLNALWKTVNTVLVAEANVYNFQPIDLSAEFKANNVCSASPLGWDWNGVISADGGQPAAFHPNSAGQRVIANATRTAIRNYFYSVVDDNEGGDNICSQTVWSGLGGGYYGYWDMPAAPIESVTSTISYEVVESTIYYQP